MMKHKLLLIIMLITLPLIAVDAQEDNTLTICGTKVTATNAKNILGDGVFSYNSSTNTLSVKGNVSIEADEYKNIIYNTIDGLIVDVTKDVTFESMSQSNMIVTKKNMTVKGNGKLTLNNPTGFAGCFSFSGDATLTIDNMTIDGTGQNVFWGSKGNEKLVINNSTVSAKCSGSGFGAIFEIGGGITLDGCHIEKPEGGYIEMKTYMGIVNEKGSIAREVLIVPGEAVEYYNLWIGGTHVSANDNLSDILGDGVFSYNPEKQTLTISGNKNFETETTIVESKIDGLTIDVTTDSELKTLGYAMQLSENTTITGEGKLTLQATNRTALGFTRQLTIENMTLDAFGFSGLRGDNSNCELTIKNSTVHATAENSAIVSRGGITFDNSYIASPVEGYINTNGVILDKDGNNAPDVLIKAGKFEEYWIRICGVEVNSENATDVLGDGVFCYDPVENKLTVKGDATCEGKTIIDNGISGLAIDVVNDATLTSVSSAAIIIGESTTLTGKGKLTLKSTNDCGLYVHTADCTIEGMTIEADGKWGFAGYPLSENIIISNSDIHSKGKEGAFCDFTSITLDGCHLVQPEGGSITDKDILDAEGNVAQEVVIARDVPDGVQIIVSDRQNDATRYNLSGQQVGRDFKGIVIENGKKILVK